MYTGRFKRPSRLTVKSVRDLGCHSLVHLLESEEARSYPDCVLEDSLHSQQLLQAAFRFYKYNSKFTDCIVNYQVKIFYLIDFKIILIY